MQKNIKKMCYFTFDILDFIYFVYRTLLQKWETSPQRK